MIQGLFISGCKENAFQRGKLKPFIRKMGLSQEEDPNGWWGAGGGVGGDQGAGPLRFRLLHRAIHWECLQVKPPSDVLIVISKDGRSSKPFVFTIHSQQMSHAAQSLDVAADTQEELSEWVAKIREATQNADARVRDARVTGTVVYRMGVDSPIPQWMFPNISNRRRLGGDFQLLFSPVQMQEGKIMERRKKIALELSELVVYCRPVPFDEDSKSWRRGVMGRDGWGEPSGHGGPTSGPLESPVSFPDGHLGAFRDWDGQGVLPGHVLLPGDQGGEVCQPQQGQEVPAVQPAPAQPHLPQRAAPGLLQL